jgi:RNA polymerase sigma-70 factor, ECF subfamily
MNRVATTPVAADPGVQTLAHVSRLTVQPGGPSPLACSTREALRETRFERDVLPLDHQLFGAAMRLTRNRQDAEDLVQEVMLRAFAGFDSFRDGTSLNAWLYRIMHNTWVSQYRRRSCRPEEVSVECISEKHLAAVVLHACRASPSAEDSALESMTDQEVSTALAGLREDVRTTVYYADVLQFSCKEIAALTNCPLGTVMSRLHRGRKRLRKSLTAAATCRGFATDQRSITPPSPAA